MHHCPTINELTVLQAAKRGKRASSGKRCAGEILLLCMTANISPENRDRLSQILSGEVDWKYLLDLAEFHSVIPLVVHNLVVNGFSGHIPQPYLGQMSQYSRATLFRSIILSSELANILAVFNRNGIPVIPLKGTVLAELLYGNPGLRTTGDIDILVPPEKLSAAGALLVDMGYQQLTTPQTRIHPFHGAPYYKSSEPPLLIDLHWDLGDRKLAVFPRQKLWRRARKVKIQTGTVMVLSMEDTLLFLSEQLPKQVDNMLRALVDMAELLRKYGSELDWDYIIKSARSWQIELSVYYSLTRSKELFGIPVPESVARTLKPVSWRWRMIGLLVSREDLTSPIRNEKLRDETFALFHCLMMKDARRMLKVLAEFRGRNKRWVWLRTSFWILVTFSLAMWRNMLRIISPVK